MRSQEAVLGDARDREELRSGVGVARGQRLGPVFDHLDVLVVGFSAAAVVVARVDRVFAYR